MAEALSRIGFVLDKWEEDEAAVQMLFTVYGVDSCFNLSIETCFSSVKRFLKGKYVGESDNSSRF